MGIIPNYLSKYGPEYYMVGCSNGLACISSFDGDEIIVANPWTREERMLQKLRVSPTHLCWGFGYDALTDDYTRQRKIGILCNGALHWVIFCGYQVTKGLIISFDLSKEVFKEIHQPDDDAIREHVGIYELYCAKILEKNNVKAYLKNMR
ncbi:hypothetical protein Tco_1168946, partial [Tanacetum coccineum]